MKPNPHEVHKQHAFDSFSKKVLKNEVRDFYNEMKRQSDHEVVFSELEAQIVEQLSVMDEYPFDVHNFNVLGYDIAIRSDLLAESLTALPAQKRDILLLYHFLDMTDKQISELLGMVRQTVQYQRTSSLRQLREMMEDFDDE